MDSFAYFLVLQFVQQSTELWPFAVLILDPVEDKLHIQGRRDYRLVASEADATILSEIVKQLETDATFRGGNDILQSLEWTLSNSIQISERIAFRSIDIATELTQLSRTLLQ